MQRDKYCLLYHLNRVSHLIKWELNNRLEDFQLTSAQWRVLMELKHYGDSNQPGDNITPAFIAERLNVERPAITRVVDSLIQANWIVKKDNPHDRRSQFVFLTDKAKRALPDLQIIGDKVMEKSFRGINKIDIQHLNAFLKGMINNFCRDNIK